VGGEQDADGVPKVRLRAQFVQFSVLTNNSSRFFIHKSIKKLAATILSKYGRAGEDCMLFPSYSVANRCRQFMKQTCKSSPPPTLRILELVPRTKRETIISTGVSAVFFPAEEFKVAKQFWQHSGDGVSSRRAEYCSQELEEGLLVEKGALSEQFTRPAKGPKRYSRTAADIDFKPSSPPAPDAPDTSRFVEERFGRNLGVEFVGNAKLAIRRRIAGTLRSDVGLTDALALSREGGRDADLEEDDVYLCPSGMSAIFNSHRFLMEALGAKKSICYGYALELYHTDSSPMLTHTDSPTSTPSRSSRNSVPVRNSTATAHKKTSTTSRSA
jgi:cystathionine gamma-synthase